MLRTDLRRNASPTFIDLFAGAGGLSIGLQQVGFNLIAATDWDHWSCETLRANHKDIPIHEGDISKIDLQAFSKQIGAKTVDLIAGGPPCQGFSQLGKRMSDDPRNQLWREYMRFVDFFKPRIFLMENVPQLLNSLEFAEIKKVSERMGYTISEKILHAADYGVPQKRKRAIIFGTKTGTPRHPRPTHIDPTLYNLLNRHLKPWRTVRDAIGDLPLRPTGKNWHVGRNPTSMSVKRYKAVPPGGNRFDLPPELTPDCWKRKPTGSTDVFGRLQWNAPSLTIRTEFFKPEKGCYLHPQAHRPITIREAARLQTFPDNYVFIGSNVHVAKQIGNAVPSQLAYAIGKELFQFLNPSAESVENETVNRFSTFQRQLA